MVVGAVGVSTAGVGLPDLDEGVAHRPAVAIEHSAVHDDPLSLRLVGVLTREVVIHLTHTTLAEHRAGHLRERVGQDGEWTDRRPELGGGVWRVRVRRIDRFLVSRVCGDALPRHLRHLPLIARWFRSGWTTEPGGSAAGG